jgi:hypothetical protein
MEIATHDFAVARCEIATIGRIQFEVNQAITIARVDEGATHDASDAHARC